MENGETPFGRFDERPGMWQNHGQQYPFRSRDDQRQSQQPEREGVPADNAAAPNAGPGNGSSEKTAANEKAEGGNSNTAAGANANESNGDAPPRYRRCGGGGQGQGQGDGGGCGRRWSGRCGNRGGPRGFRGFAGPPRCSPFGSGHEYGSGSGFGPANAIPFFLGPVADFLRSQLGDLDGNENNAAGGEQGSKNENSASGAAAEAPHKDHVPEADVFDTESAFIVHVSLPGAKKEDVGVNWDAEKSELSVAGVTYRPGDEDMLKTLALNDRKVGPFERRIRLGTRASPAMIEVDGITARLEEGILKVEIPKLDRDYVDIKKVDIE